MALSSDPTTKARDDTLHPPEDLQGIPPRYAEQLQSQRKPKKGPCLQNVLKRFSYDMSIFALPSPSLSSALSSTSTTGSGSTSNSCRESDLCLFGSGSGSPAAAALRFSFSR